MPRASQLIGVSVLHNHGLVVDYNWSKQHFKLVDGLDLWLANLDSLVALGVGYELLILLVQAVLGRQTFSESVVVDDDLLPVSDLYVRPTRQSPDLLLDPGLVALAHTCHSCNRPLTVIGELLILRHCFNYSTELWY